MEPGRLVEGARELPTQGTGQGSADLRPGWASGSRDGARPHARCGTARKQVLKARRGLPAKGELPGNNWRQKLTFHVYPGSQIKLLGSPEPYFNLPHFRGRDRIWL